MPFATGALTTVDLGFRQAFQAAVAIWSAGISNLTDGGGWVATRNELLERIGLTANF